MEPLDVMVNCTDCRLDSAGIRPNEVVIMDPTDQMSTNLITPHMTVEDVGIQGATRLSSGVELFSGIGRTWICFRV
jgi:hypothetical protein